MGKKIIKSTLFATIIMAVLFAGTVSARQLRSGPRALPAAALAAPPSLALTVASAPLPRPPPHFARRRWPGSRLKGNSHR